MQVWGITHRGSVRQQNQDAFAAETLPDGRVIALVCDGMGGEAHGGLASRIAVDVISKRILGTFSERRFQAGVEVVPQGLSLRFARSENLFLRKGVDKSGEMCYDKSTRKHQ